MGNPFNLLAIETVQNIASHLEYDSDLTTFRLICRSTNNAVDGDSSSFWRRRFLSYYEPTRAKPTGRRLIDNNKYKVAYQKRRMHIKRGTNFTFGNTKEEIACLETLRDLALDSFSGKANDASLEYVSKNLEAMKRFFENHNSLLMSLFSPSQKERETNKYNPLLQTIQVMLAPRYLTICPLMATWAFDFETSQRWMYGNSQQAPYFIGCNSLDVNMGLVLHAVNFWKYHLVREWEGTLFASFEDLEADEKPRYWTEQLKPGVQKLGRHWKGSYAFVDHTHIARMRSAKYEYGENQIQDEFNGEQEPDAFQDLTLDFVDAHAMPWSEEFEKHLQSRTPPANKAKTRAQHRSSAPTATFGDPVPFSWGSFRFEGAGYDHVEDFHADGWLNPLPPQNGVLGWQRMTMMKYFVDPDTGFIDEAALWAYEGVVLPGGNIIMGRWWSPSDGTGVQQYSGPFILWNVDGPRFPESEYDKPSTRKSEKELNNYLG